MREGAWIVMVCADNEGEQIRRQLSKVNSGCLVTYRRVEDLVLNAPTGKVALVVLAASDAPGVTKRTLSWLRGRWPRCPITVVDDTASVEREMTAREGGALYMTRPVEEKHLSALVSHLIGGRGEAEPSPRTSANPAARPDAD